MKAPPRRGYADQRPCARHVHFLWIRPFISRLAHAFQESASLSKLSMGRAPGALAGCAVVSIRYTLAPPRRRPGCLLGWRNACWKEFIPGTEIGPFSFVRWCEVGICHIQPSPM